MEDQPQAGLLGVVEPQALRQQGRPEHRHRRPNRDPLALPPEGVELGRVCRGRPLLADVARPCGDLVVRHAGAGHAREVTLDVGEEDRDTLLDELLGHQLEGLGLAGARRARDQAVPVHHRERDLDLGVLVGRVVEDGGPELERRPVEGVAGRDLGDLGREGRGCLAWGLGHEGKSSGRWRAVP